MNPMFAPLLDDFATKVAQYIASVPEDDEANSGFKAFIASLPLVPSPDAVHNLANVIDEIPSAEVLNATYLVLQTQPNRVKSLLEMHYYASKSPSKMLETEELLNVRSNLLSNFKAFKQFMLLNEITIEDFTSRGIPVEMVKKGRALEAQPTLTLPKPPTTAIRLRANSKRIRLIVDGAQAPQENLSAALLANLNMTHDEFKAIYGDDYKASHTVQINGHDVSLIITDEDED